MTSSVYPIPDVIHNHENISSITLTNAGTNYENPIVTVDPPTLGTTCTAIARSQGPVNSITLTNGGNAYSSSPTVTINGTGSGATATAIFGVVTNIAISDPGSGYSSATVTISAPPSPGVQATATANISNNRVNTVTITNGGSGYVNAPAVSFSSPQVGGDNAEGTSRGTFGQVDSITLDNAGSGYDSDTISVTISGGNGAGSTAFATVQGPVQSPITVTNGGSGYTSVPSVTITDNTGPGSGATATAVGVNGINADENILTSDVVITNDMVKPGGGGILRVYFSFQIAGDVVSTISVFNNDTFKGNLNADNSSQVVDSGYYRFDLDVESGDNINFQSSIAIDSVDFFRTHLVQFGA